MKLAEFQQTMIILVQVKLLLNHSATEVILQIAPLIQTYTLFSNVVSKKH